MRIYAVANLDVAQLVAHLVRDQEVAGSSPVIQTSSSEAAADAAALFFANTVEEPVPGGLHKELGPDILRSRKVGYRPRHFQDP